MKLIFPWNLLVYGFYFFVWSKCSNPSKGTFTCRCLQTIRNEFHVGQKAIQWTLSLSRLRKGPREKIDIDKRKFEIEKENSLECP